MAGEERHDRNSPHIPMFSWNMLSLFVILVLNPCALDATFYDVLHYQQRRRPDPVSILLANNEVRVPHGSSVFLDSQTHLVTKVLPEDHCYITVLELEVLTQRFGMLTPKKFPCAFGKGQVKYTHFGSASSQRDQVRLQLRYDTQTDTIIIPLTLHVLVISNTHGMVSQNQPLVVQKEHGYTPSIDGQGLGVKFDGEPSMCLLTPVVGIRGFPRYGTLLNYIPNGQPLTCNAFLNLGVRYKLHSAGSSQRVDFIPMLIEQLDRQGRKLLQEHFQIKVIVNGGAANSPPKPSFVALMMMEVHQFVMTAITSDMLAAEDLESEPGELIFNVLSPPEQGFVISTDDQNQPVSSFYQRDLWDLRIAYKPPAVDSNSERIFHMEFEVVDVEGSTSDRFSFMIVVKPMKTLAPVVTLNAGQLIFEGQSRPLSSSLNLCVSDEDNLADVRISVKHGLRYGTLSVLGSKRKYFTADDLAKGIVVYKHDGSETCSDNIVFHMTDGHNHVEFLFPVTIVPLDNKPPVININTGMDLVKGEMTPILPTVLSVTDLDSEDGHLKFCLVHPHSSVGQILLRQTETPTDPTAWSINEADRTFERVVTEWHLNDILEGKLFYRYIGPHLTSVLTDQFTFHVEDDSEPPNRSAEHIFFIRVHPFDDLPPQLHPGTTLQINVKEYELTVLHKNALCFKDLNTADKDLHYTIILPPVNTDQNNPVPLGAIVLTDSPNTIISEFSQAQINHGKIAYKPPHQELGETPKVVQFTFSVRDVKGNSANGLFTIVLQPVNNKPPQITNPGFTVLSNSSYIITKMALDVNDQDTASENITFVVTQTPTHGMLRCKGVDLSVGRTFRMGDIEKGLFMYIHSGSKSLHDTFNVDVNDGFHSVPITIKINIRPINVVRPQVTPHKGQLDIIVEVQENSVAVVNSTKDIRSHTDDISVTLIVDSPPRYGVIQVKGAPAVTLPLHDLISGAVTYVHTAGEVGPSRKNDSFGFIVSGKWILQGIIVQKVRVDVHVLPVDNIPPVIHAGEQFSVVEGGRNGITLEHIYAQDSDSEVDDILCTILAQPSFGYVENVSPAPGSEKSRADIAVTAFSIKDVRLRHIYYVQSLHKGTEPVEDRLSFQCTDGTNLADEFIFPIVIIPVNDEEPIIFICEFVVMEGMSLTIDLPILNAADSDIPKDNLEFEIVHNPKHGKIVQHLVTGTVPVVKFSLEQIQIGARVIYEHDGSETRNDSWTVRVTDGKHSVEKQVVVSILPVDDETPRLAVNNGLEMEIGQIKTINKKVLKATDLDSEDENLTYIIRQVTTQGFVQRCGKAGGLVYNLTVGMNFTQKDIDEELIQYVHIGQGGVRDLLKFDVTDGINPLVDRYFYITVGGVDTVFPVVVNKGVTLTEGGRVTLTTDLLTTTDLNSPDERLRYTITRPPSRGRLECTNNPGISVSSFTQLQLAGSKIRYVHTSRDEMRMDSFEFQVSDGWNEMFRTFRVSITDVDNKLPVLSVHELVLGQGQDLCITPFELMIEDQDSPNHLLRFTVTRSPLHGRLLYNSTRPVTSFTKTDLSENLITYKHDGTESDRDEILFTVTDGTHAEFYVFPDMEHETSQPQILKIRIVLDDHRAPKIVVNRPALTLSLLPTGQLGFRFSGKVLRAEDQKQRQKVPDVDLIFRVTNLPKYGLIINTETQSNSTIFTQADINEMKICYVLHDGINETSDSFHFTVEDQGGNRMHPQPFWLHWAWVSLERQTYRVQEEDGVLQVTLRRRGCLGDTSFVSISTVDGTAVSAQDFHGNAQRQVQFNPGQTSATWRLRILDDEVYETSESFQIILSEPVMTLIEQPSTAVVEIVDPQDECTVFFSKNKLQVQEDVGELLIPVQRHGDVSQELTVTCFTQPGTARGTDPGSVLSFCDYITRPEDQRSILRFEPGEREKTCRILIIDDSLYETAESFNVSLASPMGGRVRAGYPSIHVIILPHLDDEPMVFLKRSEYEVQESAGFVELQIFREGPDLSHSASVTLSSTSTSPGSAQAGVDYVAVGRSVDFAPGETMVMVRVLILDDVGGPVLEGEERFELFLHMPTNATLGQPNRATVTIHDTQGDVPTLQFALSEYKVDEADGRVVAVVTRGGDLTHRSEVRCYTRQKSAQVMMDFDERPDTDLSVITFQPGEREKTCVVTLVDDKEYEEEEEFRLVLGIPSSQSAVGIVLGRQHETLVKITDKKDKPIIQLSERRMFVREPTGVGQTSVARIAVQRLGDCSRVSVVRVHTRDGSATAGEDYTPVSVELQFEQGQSLHVVEVFVLYDTEQETRETFTVHLKPDNNMVAETQVTKAMVFIEEGGFTGGVTFPAVPLVMSLLIYEDLDQVVKKPNPPSGYPIVCVTACDRNHPEFSVLESVCGSEGVNDSLSEFRWFLGPPRAPDGSAGPLRELEAGVFLAPSDARMLDGVYFQAGWRVQCAARAVSVSAHAGLELSSTVVEISTEEGMCLHPTPGVLGAEPFSAKIRYTGPDDRTYPSLISLTITMPHVDGMLPLISTRPLADWSRTLSADASRVGTHRCSNLLDRHEVTGRHGFLTPPGGSGSRGRPPSSSSSSLWSPSARRFYSNLDLEACLWTFQGYYDMSELLSDCGGTVTSDGQVANLVQSFVSLRLPLYVSYLFHAPAGWLNFDLHTELRLTFVYDTSILWQQGIRSPQETEIQGSLYPTSMKINVEGRLVVTFKTEARFRGQFILSHPGSSLLSVVRCVDRPALSLTLSLLHTESTFNQPTQTWSFISQHSMRDYSGTYTVSLVPCVVTPTASFTQPPICNPQQRIAFNMEVRFQQVSDPVPVEFTLNTFFYLLAKRELWLSDGSMGFGEGADVTFSQESHIYGRIVVDPVQNLGDSFVCRVERVFLCAGADGYVPKYRPAGGEYGCLVDAPALVHRFKILDKTSPETQASTFGNVPFQARLADDTPGAEPLVIEPGSDGFSLSAAPLFQVAAGKQWYIHVVYTMRSSKRNLRHRRSLSPNDLENDEPLDNHTIVYHAITSPAKQENADFTRLDSASLTLDLQARSRREVGEEKTIGQGSGRGTNLQHISLQYPPSSLRLPDWAEEAEGVAMESGEDTDPTSRNLSSAMLVLIAVAGLSAVALIVYLIRRITRNTLSLPPPTHSTPTQPTYAARKSAGRQRKRDRGREDCDTSEV